ncbi:unnamed protein product [Acanthosepion pharaonis]|uniref:Reverse transcriptase domain-containing protein n=1 Tax=Acanthosepion pharaonis TaxID=158019 RepID=A0A812BHQ6_ACAPH|nr:unnamed protein product [Sepia pharaonis]
MLCNDEAPRLPPKVTQHGHPTAQTPARPSQVEQRLIRTVPRRQRPSFFSMMTKQATEDLEEDDAVYVCYRLDGSLFNSLFKFRRLQAHTKTLEQLFCDLLFADDTVLDACTERALHRLTSRFAEAARLFGLEMSLKKTQVLHHLRKSTALPTSASARLS